jgi:hypothetical protein
VNILSYPTLAIPAARPGFRASVSDKGADAVAGIGHVMHTSATTVIIIINYYLLFFIIIYY